VLNDTDPLLIDPLISNGSMLQTDPLCRPLLWCAPLCCAPLRCAVLPSDV